MQTRNELERDPNSIVPVVFDDIFKIVFGKEENADITAYLVSLLLKIPYERVKGRIKFKSTSHIKKMVSEKNSEKDIVFIVDTSEPLKINIEMNRADYLEPSIINRNVYFHSNLFGSGLKRKNEYENLTTTIQYNFNLEYVDKIGEELIDEFVYRNQRGFILTEKSKIVHLNIKKMAELWYSNEYKKYKEISPILFGLSALILETDKQKFEFLVESIKFDQDIKEQLERIVMSLNVDDELVTKYYDLEEERKKMNEAVMKDAVERISKEMEEKIKKEAELKGQLKGQLEGKLEEKKEIIFNMIKNNLPIETIANCTNLTINEVKDIINQN